MIHLVIFGLLTLAASSVTQGQQLEGADLVKCVASNQSFFAIQEVCFSNNAKEIHELLLDLGLAFVSPTNVISVVTQGDHLQTLARLWDSFCEQRCIDAYADYVRDCVLPILSEQDAKIFAGAFELFVDVACARNGDGEFCLTAAGENKDLIVSAATCAVHRCTIGKDGCISTLDTIIQKFGCCFETFYTSIVYFLNVIGIEADLASLEVVIEVFELCGSTRPELCERTGLVSPFTGSSGALSLGAISLVLTIGATAIGQFLVHLFM